MSRTPGPSMLPLEPRTLMAADITPAVVLPPPVTALGAFNADARADQATLRRISTPTGPELQVQLGLGKGNGTFTPSDSVRLPGHSAVAAVAADLDGDAKLDVVFLGPNPDPKAPASAPKVFAFGLLTDGAGHFRRSPTTGAPLVLRVGIPRLVSATSLAVGDFDGDARPDVAALGKSELPTMGPLPAPIVTTLVVSWGVPPLLPVIYPPTVLTPAGNPPLDALFAGDVDGDKKPDLVATRRSVPPSPLVPAATAPSVVQPPDLVTVRFPTRDRYKPAVSLSRNPIYNLPSITTATPTTTTLSPRPDMETIGLADLDGNGTADLVGRRGNTILFASWRPSTINPSSGTFAPATPVPSYNAPPNLPSTQSLLADLNGDARPDLLTTPRYSPGPTHIALNLPSLTGKPTLKWSAIPIFYPA